MLKKENSLSSLLLKRTLSGLETNTSEKSQFPVAKSFKPPRNNSNSFVVEDNRENAKSFNSATLDVFEKRESISSKVERKEMERVKENQSLLNAETQDPSDSRVLNFASFNSKLNNEEKVSAEVKLPRISDIEISKTVAVAMLKKAPAINSIVSESGNSRVAPITETVYHSVPGVLLDFCPKSKVVVTSSASRKISNLMNSFSASLESKSICANTSFYLKDRDVNISPAMKCYTKQFEEKMGNASLDFHSNLYYYCFPNESLSFIDKPFRSVAMAPINKSLTTISNTNIADSRMVHDVSSIFISQKWMNWEDAFHSLYTTFLNQDIPYFLFLSKTIQAIFCWLPKDHVLNSVVFLCGITSSTRAAMKSFGVEFSQPFADDNHDQTIPTYILNTVSGQNSASLAVENRKREKTEFERDNESVILVSGSHSKLLFTFLLTFHPRSEDFPSLISHSPFLFASLQKLQVTSLSSSCVEISGPILPLTFLFLQKYFISENEDIKFASTSIYSLMGSWNILASISISKPDDWYFGVLLKSQWPDLFEENSCSVNCNCVSLNSIKLDEYGNIVADLK